MSRAIAVLDLHFAEHSALPDLVSTLLHELSTAAIHETGSDAAPVWRVFFASAAARDQAHRAVRERFAAYGLRIETGEVRDEDWAARSQAALRAIRIEHIVVAPPWDVPSTFGRDDRLVVISPSMGFGTGHHATTRLCLRLLQRIDCTGRRVLDIGTGSGVLAIAAAVLGAADVAAIDLDPDAIANTEENIAANRAAGRIGATVRASVADLRDSHSPADIVLANLTGATLVAAAPQIADHVSAGGLLVVSGFLTHEADEVVRAFERLADCEAMLSEDEWRAGLFRAIAKPRVPGVP